MKNFSKAVTATVLALAVSFSCAISADAQKYNKYENSYNFQKAMEAFNDDDNCLAEESLEKELDEHPDNGYAYLYLAQIHLMKREYGKATGEVEMALRYIPKRDRSFRATCYFKKAGILAKLDKLDEALVNFTESIRLDPEESIYYRERADIYYLEEKYDLADADFRAMLQLNPNQTSAWMGLGRSELARKHYDEAVDIFSDIITLYDDYSSAHSFRADAYFQLGKYMEAATDVVRAMEIDYDKKAFIIMVSLADSAFVQITSKLKAQAVKDPNNAYWPYCLGISNEEVEHFETAIGFYERCNVLDEDAAFYERISTCYESMGQWSSAIEATERGMELDSTYDDLLLKCAHNHYQTGLLKEAIALMDKYVAAHPDDASAYYWRGWYEDNLRQVDKAIEDYTVSITLNPDHLYAYLTRGNMYDQKGLHELAQKDYEMLLVKDTIPEYGSCRMYALQHLDRTKEALEWMDRMLATDQEEEATRYEAACLYVMTGNLEKALDDLEEALLLGYKSYHHIMTDDQLEPLRQLPRFGVLMDRFFPKEAEIPLALTREEAYVETVHEVPFTRQNGILKVQCAINGLPLHFVFDTGASTVSLSSLEANFMYKNDFLSSADVVGKSDLIDANGDVSVGTVINLQHVDFAGLQLNNVKASVVDNNVAPLLLGQSVLNRLGKVEIDYEHRILRITSKKLIEISKKDF